MLINKIGGKSAEKVDLVETLLTTWNQIKRELIVASEIYQSMRITYLIQS